MSERFAGLKKVSREPAARMLAMAGVRLDTPLKAPASAPIETVLAELDAVGAAVDLLRMMAVALPPRERVWWACLAARDVLGEGGVVTPALAAAEQWVFKPTDEARAAARTAVETAEMDDETTLCGLAVMFCDGTLGTGDLAHHPAPPGASQLAALGMNVKALATQRDDVAGQAAFLLDRALDIARGGNGRIERQAAKGGAT